VILLLSIFSPNVLCEISLLSLALVEQMKPTKLAVYWLIVLLRQVARWPKHFVCSLWSCVFSSTLLQALQALQALQRSGRSPSQHNRLNAAQTAVLTLLCVSVRFARNGFCVRNFHCCEKLQ
jgi:hypothetical protein